ncbi:IclR family transcriptional regulator [Cognatishimia sp. MH4019]|uniref:IclR family transcriptional regulator n=1 Tax=Cognatishimia sp. MH4019 TaxID=2854030 RepID=UPI001CD5D065|nr:IclR family transcriptional regulator [Cognatishimia sp. MH4019]
MQSSIVAKLLKVLTIISETRKPLTFSEIVAQSGMNKSTIHRILAICTQEKLVQFDKQRKVYLVGSKVFDLVRNAYSGYDIQAIALDDMLRLHAQVEGSVTIGILSGMEVVYLRILESDYALGTIQRPGMREQVHCSASGKALMAFLPDNMIDAKFKDYNFKPYTDRTITDLPAFKTAVDEVRRAGFAWNDREEYDHLVGISAPVFNYLNEPIAVLNVWTVHARHSLPDILNWSAMLKEAADNVTGLIGGAPPEIDALKAG